MTCLCSLHSFAKSPTRVAQVLFIRSPKHPLGIRSHATLAVVDPLAAQSCLRSLHVPTLSLHVPAKTPT